MNVNARNYVASAICWPYLTHREVGFHSVMPRVKPQGPLFACHNACAHHVPFVYIADGIPADHCGLLPGFRWDDVSSQSRSQMFVPLAPQTSGNRRTELLFSRTNTWFCVHTAQEYLDLCTTKDSAEFQIVTTISNHISILYSINLSF
jgi:hypothetical protein